MSQHEVLIYKAKLLPHPNADMIELCQIGDYLSIVKKGDFKEDQPVAYIPEQSIVPEPLLEEMGLKNKLSGAARNRVKAIKLRGTLSQGLVYVKPGGYAEEDVGRNVAEELGIIKWSPTLPVHLRGKAKGMAYDITVNYDIENIKKWNRHIEEGDLVVITEKIHGTNVQIGYAPRCGSSGGGVGISYDGQSSSGGPDGGGSGVDVVSSETRNILFENSFWVSSKGLGGRGIILDMEDSSNVYANIARSIEYNLLEKIRNFYTGKNLRHIEYLSGLQCPPIVLIGEIFGPGIQTGFHYGQTKPEFRLFDIAVGPRNNRMYLSWDDYMQAAFIMGIPTVPTLYIGPFSKEILAQYTSGKEKVTNHSHHMREGCVVRLINEKSSGNLGRVILKSISEEYLTRKGTEEELTEYQ